MPAGRAAARVSPGSFPVLPLLAGLLSAMLLTMAHRPAFPGWWAAAALVPILLVAPAVRGWPLALLAAAAGLGIALPMFESVLLLAPAGFPLLLLFVVPQFLLPLWAWRAAGGAAGGTRAVVAFAATWTLCEVLAGQSRLLGGFASFHAFAYSQFDTPLLAAVRFSGTSLVSFTLAALNGALAAVLGSRDWRPLLVVLLPLPLLLLPRPAVEPAGPEVAIGIVQPDFTVLELSLAEAGAGSVPATLHALAALSAQAAQSGAADLIAWPETTVPRGTTAQLLERLFTVPGPVLLGNVATQGGAQWNAASLLEAGELVPVYGKLLPVPLVETSWAQAPGFVAAVVLDSGAVLAPLICLDSAHADVALQAARSGAGILVVLGSSAFAGQLETARLHLRLTAFRAAELGIPVVFLASGGPSALIDAQGRVVTELPQGRQAATLFSVTPSLAATTYARHGDWFGLLVCPFLALAGLRRLRCPGPPGSSSARTRTPRRREAGSRSR